MGVDRKIAFLLIEEANKRPFSGSVLQLGKQDIALSWQMLDTTSRRLGFHNHQHDACKTPSFKRATFVSDVDFFKYIGFSEVYSLDHSAFEGAGIIFDLNAKNVPDNMKNKYDVIFDGGTMEHVFDCPQVLKHIYEMLRIGGRIIHFSPIFNHINHGFYFYSPTLFMDYYGANTFTIHVLSVIKESLRRAYACNCLDRKAYSKIDKLRGFSGAYFCYVVASKTTSSRSDVIPQQGLYGSTWSNNQIDGGDVRPKYLEVVKRLSKKSFAYFRVLRFLRGQLLRSWFYRQYINRSVQWKRLPM